MLSILSNTDAKGKTITLAINQTRNFSATIMDKTGIISVGAMVKEVGLDFANAISDVLLHAQKAMERQQKKVRGQRRQFSSLVSAVGKLPEGANLIQDIPIARRSPGRPRKNLDPVANQTATATAPAVAPAALPPTAPAIPAAPSVPAAVAGDPGTPPVAPPLEPIHAAKRHPGRPKKEEPPITTAPATSVPAASSNAPVAPAVTTPKRGPGRPRKMAAAK